jgi:hypothetical protein
MASRKPPPIRVEVVVDETARPSRLIEVLGELIARRAKAAVAKRLAADKAGQGNQKKNADEPTTIRDPQVSTPPAAEARPQAEGRPPAG